MTTQIYYTTKTAISKQKNEPKLLNFLPNNFGSLPNNVYFTFKISILLYQRERETARICLANPLYLQK